MRSPSRRRRGALVALTIAATFGVACVELKAAAPDTDASTSGDAEASARDASDASFAGDGPLTIDPRAIELASKRRRLGDVPKAWFVSQNFLYVVEDKLRRVRLSSGSSLEYAFAIPDGTKIVATDAFIGVASSSAATFYDAEKPNYGQSFLPQGIDDAIALLDDNFAWTVQGASPPTRAVYKYHPVLLNDPALVSSVDPANAAIVGKRFREVYLHSKGASEVAVVDTATNKLTKWVLPSNDLLRVDGVVDSTTEVVAAFGTPQQPIFKQLGKAGVTRDLTAEIMGIENELPKPSRQPTDMLSAQSGKWFVFVTAAGIFAFDRSASSLIPCQLPQSTGTVFHSPRVVEGDTLVFELEGGDEVIEGKRGLFALKLGDVLPQ